MIPARIVNFWDFRKKPVSNEAFSILSINYSNPLLHIPPSHNIYTKIFDLYRTRVIIRI